MSEQAEPLDSDIAEMAQMIIERDHDALAARLAVRAEEELGRELGRELDARERLYCHTSARLAVFGELVRIREEFRRQDDEAFRAKQLADSDPLHWHKLYASHGVCYTLDAIRLVDRSPTTPLAQWRGRIIGVRGEHVRVEWSIVPPGLSFDYAQVLEIDRPPPAPFVCRDEPWSRLTVWGHPAMCMSDIPGAPVCGGWQRFDPTTGLIYFGPHDEPKKYVPMQTFDVRVLAP